LGSSTTSPAATHAPWPGRSRRGDEVTLDQLKEYLRELDDRAQESQLDR
jgi:hypothetical protein